jgi:hypothetical protein
MVFMGKPYMQGPTKNMIVQGPQKLNVGSGKTVHPETIV